MFHNFNAHQPAPAPAPAAPRRLNKSCSECTRRKVKCDGADPCESCINYKVPQLCNYRQRTRRHAVSRSAHEGIAEQLKSRTCVLEQLFPATDLDSLTGKSRNELLTILQCISTSPGSTTSPQSNSIAGDDINAINLATDHRRRSYLGITSVSAILRAIFRLCPTAKHLVAENAQKWATSSVAQIRPSVHHFGVEFGSNQLREQRCVDFYFEHIHAIAPMLDEDEFRAFQASGHRRDRGWLALLNMVLTLGSIASGSKSLHEHYYEQARSFLDLDSLGAGNIETLQALSLLGGMYLHYCNAPNMAYAVLGSAHRVAIALGLHREPRKRGSSTVEADREAAPGRLSRTEVKRRTWWSLFCLDTWASMTLGRPTLGRWEESTMDTQLPTPAADGDYIAESLHRFAQFGRLTVSEVKTFDQELQDWYKSVPLTVAREFMRNRYYNIRLILLRSIVVYLAQGRIRRVQFTEDEEHVMTTCRLISSEAVDSIALHWTPDKIHACMVPALFIAVERSRSEPNREVVSSATSSLAKALETFSEMRPWMRVSDRSPDINDGQGQTPSQDGDSSFFGWYDEQLTFTGLDWASFMIDEDFQGNLFQDM
ncbi:fungal-specific transcription factor domain-containing protein [Xylariaceae sp. FL0016]|nr:fungal-specific transcription factor domain-containing protein [Xylariaceae sp. FL0016]